MWLFCYLTVNLHYCFLSKKNYYLKFFLIKLEPLTLTFWLSTLIIYHGFLLLNKLFLPVGRKKKTKVPFSFNHAFLPILSTPLSLHIPSPPISNCHTHFTDRKRKLKGSSWYPKTSDSKLKLLGMVNFVWSQYVLKHGFLDQPLLRSEVKGWEHTSVCEFLRTSYCAVSSMEHCVWDCFPFISVGTDNYIIQ